MGHARPAAEQALDEVLERTLDPRRRLLRGCELRVEVEVAEAAREDAPVRILVPVVEAVAAVVRHRKEALGHRLGGDHLAARRDNQPFELAEQAARIAVRRDDDGRRLELTEVVYPRVLAKLRAGVRSRGGEPPHEARRLQHSVRGVEERAREAACQRLRQRVAPLGLEPVLPQGGELLAQLVALLLVGREPQAADAPKGVAAELFHPVDVALGEAPVVGCLLGAEPVARAVVRHRAAP